MKVIDFRAEQLVAGEWVELPTDDLTLRTGINHTPQLLVGRREILGQWRVFFNGNLAYQSDPMRSWRIR